MIAGKKVLAVIPARGGSKGVPRKNIRSVAGKPLLAWTVTAARESAYIDLTVLSTDDDEILATGRALGCAVPFVRDKALAGDDATGIDVILDAVSRVPGFDLVVMLQPTSPLRRGGDIDEVLRFLVAQNCKSCVTLSETKSPAWMFYLKEDGRMEGLLGAVPLDVPRQRMKKAYVLNGAVYVADVQWLKGNKSFFSDETRGVVLPEARALDIDTEEDLIYAAFRLGVVDEEA